MPNSTVPGMSADVAETQEVIARAKASAETSPSKPLHGAAKAAHEKKVARDKTPAGGNTEPPKKPPSKNGGNGDDNHHPKGDGWSRMVKFLPVLTSAVTTLLLGVAAVVWAFTNHSLNERMYSSEGIALQKDLSANDAAVKQAEAWARAAEAGVTVSIPSAMGAPTMQVGPRTATPSVRTVTGPYGTTSTCSPDFAHEGAFTLTRACSVTARGYPQALIRSKEITVEANGNDVLVYEDPTCTRSVSLGDPSITVTEGEKKHLSLQQDSGCWFIAPKGMTPEKVRTNPSAHALITT